MLKILRHKGVAKKVLWVVAVIIIISFGFFGTAYQMSNRMENSAGKIFGKKVTLQDFQNAHQNVRTQAIIRYGDNFQQVSQFLNLDAETWDRLILLNEASKRHININNKEVVDAIADYPFFQKNGQFDTLLYNDILRYVFQMQAHDFEESVRDSLKFKKIFDTETSSVIVSEEEAVNKFKRDNEKIQISYAIIKPEQFLKETELNPTEALQFYNDHKLEFIIPPSINAEYIVIDWEKVTAADAASPENISEKQKSDTLLKAKGLLASLGTDSNLHDVASKNNLKVETTGHFSALSAGLPTKLPFSVLTEIAQLSAGQLGGPYESPQGFVIAKVVDQKESYVPSYEEIQDKIKEAYIKENAMTVAKEKAKEYAEQIKTALSTNPAKDFPATAKGLGLEITQTPVFNRGTYLPGIGISAEFQEAAFALTEKDPVSGSVSVTNGFCILHLDEIFPINQKDFEQQKESLREETLAEKKNQAFSEYLSALRLKANLVDNVSAMRGRAEQN